MSARTCRGRVADELDQRVQLELRGERLADAVHGRQLGDALARLVDRAARSRARRPCCPRSSRAAADRTRRRRTRGRGSGASHARRRTADDERREDREPWAARRRRSPGCRTSRRRIACSRGQQRLAGLDHVLPEADQRRIRFGSRSPRSIWYRKRRSPRPRRGWRCRRPVRRRPRGAPSPTRS